MFILLETADFGYICISTLLYLHMVHNYLLQWEWQNTSRIFYWAQTLNNTLFHCSSPVMMLLRMFILVSFHPFSGIWIGIRGLTGEALNIRGNQVSVFLLRAALKSEVLRSIAWETQKEICNRRHSDSRSSTDSSLTTKWAIKWIETKSSFRSPTVKMVSGRENILSNNHYRLALAFCSP